MIYIYIYIYICMYIYLPKEIIKKLYRKNWLVTEEDNTPISIIY